MDHQESAEERAMVRQLSQKLRQVSAFSEGLDFGKGLGSGDQPGVWPEGGVWHIFPRQYAGKCA
jgi:uncharacterized protein YaeQ